MKLFIFSEAALEARLSEHEKNKPEKFKPPPSQNAEDDEHRSDGDCLPQMLPTFSPDMTTTDFSNTSAWFAPIVDASLLPPPIDCVDDPCSTSMFLSPEHVPIKEHLSLLVCSDL